MFSVLISAFNINFFITIIYLFIFHKWCSTTEVYGKNESMEKTLQNTVLKERSTFFGNRLILQVQQVQWYDAAPESSPQLGN